MDFRFKYFTVSQENSALKVGTDAMVLGATCSFPQESTLLDIGTGTGVLALILAQRFSPTKIVALEPDVNACIDAAKNFDVCHFPQKPQLIPLKAQDFFPEFLFDGIISNPPYFIDSTKSGITGKDNARHQTDLPLGELLTVVQRLLAKDGVFWIILPFDQQEYCISLASKNQLFPESIIEVQGKPGKPVRTVISFRKKESNVDRNVIVIRNNTGSYSKEYISLTRELHGKALE